MLAHANKLYQNTCRKYVQIPYRQSATEKSKHGMEVDGGALERTHYIMIFWDHLQLRF